MKINCRFVERVLCGFIRDELGRVGFSRAVLGLSGGLDSSVCACLAAKALRPENVLALIMPFGDLGAADAKDAESWARQLKIRIKIINIAPMVDAYFALEPSPDRNLRGNKMARERMSILYDQSARDKALVLGTSNKTELLVGYGTLYGDTASAVNPLGDLYKTQVRQLAGYLGVPQTVQNKVPSAGLWTGQTDEGELGLGYEELDKILFSLVDQRLSPAEVVQKGFAVDTVERIVALIKGSEFKRHMPLIAKLSRRTVGIDFLYARDWGK
jgi:NAD+ synthase